MLGPLEDSLNDSVSPLNPVQRQRQTLIYKNSLRLLKHVNSLLDFARIQSSRMKASFEPVDLAQLTTDLAPSFRSLIENVHTESLGNEVYLDREMYEKIIFNLLR